MAVKKKQIGKAGAIFLLAMLVLTFCSRTVYRSLMPSVRTARVSGGILSYSTETNDYILDSSDLEYAYVDARLPENVRVDRLLVQPNQRVEVGDPLLKLYAPEAERALAAAKEQFAEAEVAWKSWDSTYTDAYLELQEKMNSEALSAERKSQLLQQMELLQQGIVGDTSEQLRYAAYSQARTLLAALEALQAADWQVFAPTAGWVCDVLVKAGDPYEGLAPLVSITGDTGDVLIGLRWNEDIDLDRQAARIKASMAMGDQRLDCQYVRTTTVDGQKIAWLQCAEPVAYEKLTQITMQAESKFIETLVSQEALHGDSVFALSTRQGAWGEIEYYAEEIKLTRGSESATMVEVRSGLYSGQEIIIKSNKELSDGQTVLLEGVY